MLLLGRRIPGEDLLRLSDDFRFLPSVLFAKGCKSRVLGPPVELDDEGVTEQLKRLRKCVTRW
jgi:hypothetical protein